MAGLDGLDLESFTDMSVNMMANQIDLFMSSLPSLPHYEADGVPDELKQSLLLLSKFGEQVAVRTSAVPTACMLRCADFFHLLNGG